MTVIIMLVSHDVFHTTAMKTLNILQLMMMSILLFKVVHTIRISICKKI